MSEEPRFIGPVAVHRSSLMAASEQILALTAVPNRSGGVVHLVNAYNIVLAENDERYRACLNSGLLNLADGKPVAILARSAQVRGPALFEEVLSLGQDRGIKHFLLGGTPATLYLLKQQLLSRFPKLNIVGAYSPPFEPPNDHERIRQSKLIRDSAAALVWVGLGTPKQDFEAELLSRESNAIFLCVGAAFDFSAGTKRVAPQVVRSLGLEWLFRLLSEPKRLGYRYVVGNVLFLRIVGKQLAPWNRRRA